MQKWAPFWASFLPGLVSPFIFLGQSQRFLYDAFVLVVVQWFWMAPIAGFIALVVPRPAGFWPRVAMGLGLGLLPVLVRMTLLMVGRP